MNDTLAKGGSLLFICSFFYNFSLSIINYQEFT